MLILLCFIYLKLFIFGILFQFKKRGITFNNSIIFFYILYKRKENTYE